MAGSELAAHELFSGIPEVALQAMQAASTVVEYARGDMLLKQGDQAQALFYIQAGRFKVVVDKTRTVAHLEAGEIVGELAFFAGGERTADVIATRDSKVLRIARSDYLRIAETYSELPHSLLKMVASRLASATARTRSVKSSIPRVIGVLPAGSSTLAENFLTELQINFSKIVGDRRPVSVVAQHDLTNLDSYPAWLANEEAKGGYIIVDCSGSTDWSAQALRNIDALLMVANAKASDHQPSALERAALHWVAPENRLLALVHEGQLPNISATANWLNTREPALHLQMVANKQADFARLGRFLSGRAVGLVLAGGGALGCSHLGVIQALLKAQIPIDYIGGASAGAAMGAAIARGLSPTQTIDQMEQMFVAAGALKRLTIPVHSLLDPTVFDAQLRNRYGTIDIADLPIPFFAVSTNLSTSELHIHRRGPLWESVRASGSLPTILPPFIDHQGQVLVDGGVLDNLPVTIMQSLKKGPNIVVALDALDASWHSNARYNQVRSRGALLRDIVLRRKPEENFPSIFETTQRSMVVTSRIASRQIDDETNILLTPPRLQGMQILDWHRGRELAELSEQYALNYIDQHPEKFSTLIATP